jgi:hypothetical protein
MLLLTLYSVFHRFSQAKILMLKISLPRSKSVKQTVLSLWVVDDVAAVVVALIFYVLLLTLYNLIQLLILKLKSLQGSRGPQKEKTRCLRATFLLKYD